MVFSVHGTTSTFWASRRNVHEDSFSSRVDLKFLICYRATIMVRRFLAEKVYRSLPVVLACTFFNQAITCNSLWPPPVRLGILL